MPMNLKLKNITSLFKNVRTRTIIILTALIVVFTLLFGLGHFIDKTTAPADSSVQLKDAPDVESIPGGLQEQPSRDYQRLQQQQNLQEAALAEKTGESAIPTLLSSSQFDEQSHLNPLGPNACCQPCPCSTSDHRSAAAACAGPVLDQLLQPSQLRTGTLVYDAKGQVIGRLGDDGKVRNEDGEIIGQVGPDGLVRSADGSVIGSAAAPAMGDPVYDAAGHLIGHVQADGKVIDAQGRLIGTVSPDGIVRDLKGGVIGRVGGNTKSQPAEDRPVYDAKGHLLGTIGKDGKIRDAKGNIVGTVGADGVIRDMHGQVIAGAHVGRASDKKAHIIPGTPVYDDQGKLIGTVGLDGRVRDSQGKVIGTVAPDGSVRDLTGQILGKVGATEPGIPVYDQQGRLIGTVGRDGTVRDSEGKTMATVGADGIARDAQGNIMGSTAIPRSITNNLPSANPGLTNLMTPSSVSLLPSTSDSTSPALQAILDRQAQQISAQKAEQLQQQLQSSMTTQASQLFVAWASPTQQYVLGTPSLIGQMVGVGTTPTGSSLGTLGQPPAVKAGTIMYAALLTAVNSDEPGPVLAEIVQGPLKGARLIGTLSNQGKKVLLAFNTLTLAKIPQSIPINTVAIDESTARTALSSYTNNHYWLRYGTLFASAFLQGYGQSFLASNSTYAGAIVINPTNTTPNLNPRDRVFVGLGQVGVQYASVLGSIFSTPPTVHVYSGTPMGILFLSDLAALPKSS